MTDSASSTVTEGWNSGVEVRDAVPATEFPTSGLLNGVDIGLAPMADTAVSRSRTPNKVMDYVHRGIPYVGSPSDAYNVRDL